MSGPAGAESQAAEVVLVATKLHAPAGRPELVSRGALVDRLVAGGDRRLALLCAPAGWGKTSVLGQWRASGEESRPFAWVSLDGSDDDPARFWAYVIAALRTVDPEVGGSALAALPHAGPALAEAVLPRLINDLSELQTPLVLVLDDYHVLHSPLIHDSTAFLLLHLPRTVQLAIASRADPPLPLARLRAANDVVELRAAELRFTEGETDAFLNGSLALGLEAADVGLLQERTEGWPAGLQLAALSLQAQADRHGFVREFAGDDRQIGDYLHEVIEGQPDPLRRFLLQTSILSRLCAPLCEAVAGGADAVSLLQNAYRSNLFVVALDSNGQWFRYHHLFRELLLHELIRSAPELAPELHRRAFAWHDEQGNADEAVFHATQAGDFEAAAELIARHWISVWQFSPGTVARWIDGLPPETVRHDPRLCLVRGWTSLFLGSPADVEGWIEAAEQCGRPETILVGVGSIAAGCAILRAPLAYGHGDVAHAGRLAREAVRLSAGEPFGAHLWTMTFVGLTDYFAGDSAAAVAPLEEVRRRLPEPVFPQVHLTSCALLALIKADERDADAAKLFLDAGARLIDQYGLRESPTAAPLETARGKLLQLRGDLEGAEAALEHASHLARRAGWPLDLGYVLLAHADVKRRRRDIAGARQLAREARRVLSACPDPGMLGDLLARLERSLQLAPSPGAPAASAATELSERELAVLRLLATDLSQREIGAQLYVSFNTVKSHTRSLFRKLEVSTRADAVARGRERGLI
jgi:ATP/maltotriose-dependent transcriptional regulator MalT